jgi:hypothetical protein
MKEKKMGWVNVVCKSKITTTDKLLFGKPKDHRENLDA